MEKGYGIEEFSGFMEMIARKGLLNTATANARKQAALQVLESLDEEEKGDLRSIEIDGTFERFANLNSSRFTPDSLRTYKTRFKKGLEDFLAWKKNPMTFKPNVVTKKARIRKSDEAEILSPQDTEITTPPTTYRPSFQQSIDVFPIRIRENVVVQVAHLPHDLTEAEAQKIARVIQAHVLEKEDA